MKIAILQTGDVAANLLAKFGDYPNMFFSLFKRAGKTKSIFSWTVFDVRKDKYPVSPYDADGYLITGSRHGATNHCRGLNRCPTIYACCAPRAAP